MEDQPFLKDIINLKADDNHKNYKTIMEEFTQHCVTKISFTDCAPSTPNEQIQQIFKDAKDNEVLAKKLMTLANAYLCLHRYALNLCGKFNMQIARQIKVIFFLHNFSIFFTFLCFILLG